MGKKKGVRFAQTEPRIPDIRKQIEVKALNKRQHDYLKTIERCDYTFAEGSAGSGKTFLAAMVAMKYMSEGRIDKIVICRPAVTAGGEDLGFLPGGIQDKMDPYIQPIFDAFRTYWSTFTIRDLLQDGRLEIVPLAFMRGRTFRDCFVICDEAQNATSENLLMLLTRLGDNSKMVITGDPLQSDINGYSCLRTAKQILSEIPEVGFIKFSNQDVVRHPTVAKILNVWPNNGIEENETPKDLPAFINKRNPSGESGE